MITLLSENINKKWGHMNKLIGLAPLAIILAACGPLAQRAWEKSGASRDYFARDRYACMQQSQQNASYASVHA